MADTIRIQMMGSFTIYINEQQADHLVNKSRKGLAVMQYLIMSRGKRVSNRRLATVFWPEESVSNPESALKTLISRVRTLLNQVSDGLGGCIGAERGSYYWQSLPGVTVDVYELEDAFALLAESRDEQEREAAYNRVLRLYAGDLLKNSELNQWALPRAVALHNDYVKAVCGYVSALKKREDYAAIIPLCRRALEIEPFDDRLHIELMNALLRSRAAGEAKAQYEEVMYLHYHYLNAEPSQELKEFYNQIVEASGNIECSLEAICKDLREHSGGSTALVCEYTVFKEIFQVQMRNIDRLGYTLFLAVVMVSKLNGQPMDGLKQGNVMRDLLEIMRVNLRKGDIITHYSPTMVALLLPTVNYTTGDAVMERIKRKFYEKYPNSSVRFSYRIAPLSPDTGAPAGGGGRRFEMT